MEDKYYTPDIEDLFVGYECERIYYGDDEDTWIPHIIGFEYDWLEIPVNYNKALRTPFLTKEQIEKEGWTFKTEYTGLYRLTFEKGNSWLGYNPENHMMVIIPIDPVKEFYEHHQRYAGSCKSINEFRKITKWLGI